jgi:hypothetical protein
MSEPAPKEEKADDDTSKESPAKKKRTEDLSFDMFADDANLPKEVSLHSLL